MSFADFTEGNSPKKESFKLRGKDGDSPQPSGDNRRYREENERNKARMELENAKNLGKEIEMYNEKELIENEEEDKMEQLEKEIIRKEREETENKAKLVKEQERLEQERLELQKEAKAEQNRLK